MRPCHRARLALNRSAVLQSVCRRCKSYDQARYTEEYWLGKVEEGLGGRPESPRIDTTTNSVRTSAGDLPISPIFDPKWISKKTRKTKAKQTATPSGRFQSKVHNNIYVRALETPLRSCMASTRRLPRYFLQDFEVVAHPTTGRPWWAPGPLSFNHIENDKFAASSEERLPVNSETGERYWAKPLAVDLGKPTGGKDLDSDEVVYGHNLDDATRRADVVGPHVAREHDLHSTSQSSDNTISSSAESDLLKSRPSERGSRSRAPIVAYVAAKKSVLEDFNVGKPPLGRGRAGLAIDSTFETTYWRPDMPDFLLAMYRRYAVDALIRRATRPEGKDPYFYIQPCENWEAVQNVRLRGAVLWLPKSEVTAGGYQTVDLDVAYGKKLAVYNLPWLLGEEEVRRLEEEAPTFRAQEILVLKAWPTWGMKSLHMLLWRLQGYLVQSQRIVPRRRRH